MCTLYKRIKIPIQDTVENGARSSKYLFDVTVIQPDKKLPKNRKETHVKEIGKNKKKEKKKYLDWINLIYTCYW